MKIGNPLDRDTDHGPQNHLAHLQKLLEYCQRGVEEGATLVCGGKQVPRPGQSPADRAAGGVASGAVSRGQAPAVGLPDFRPPIQDLRGGGAWMLGHLSDQV